jgi:hypothetical protein
MKKLLTVPVIVSVLLGALLTMASTAFFTGAKSWRVVDKCYSAYNNQLPSSINNVYCSGLEYGFPVHSMYVKPKVEVSPMGNNPEAKTLIGVSGTVRFSPLNLVINFVIWTAVSFAIIWLIRWLRHQRRASKMPPPPPGAITKDIPEDEV